MSEHDRDEIERAALLKHIGMTSVAALARRDTDFKKLRKDFFVVIKS